MDSEVTVYRAPTSNLPTTVQPQARRGARRIHLDGHRHAPRAGDPPSIRRHRGRSRRRSGENRGGREREDVVRGSGAIRSETPHVDGGRRLRLSNGTRQGRVSPPACEREYLRLVHPQVDRRRRYDLPVHPSVVGQVEWWDDSAPSDGSQTELDVFLELVPDDPAQILEFLETGGDVEKVGEESLFGDRDDAIPGDGRRGRTAEQAPADVQRALGAAADGVQEGATLSVDVWVDENGLLRRLAVEGQLGDAGHVAMRVDLYDFGTEGRREGTAAVQGRRRSYARPLAAGGPGRAACYDRDARSR